MVDAGEIITLRGEVTEVREESGRQLAVCEIEAVNSAGDTVTNGMVEAWMG